MKNFLQNLLIFFSLCLCAVIAYQGVRDTKLYKQIQKLSDTVHDKYEIIQNQERKLKLDEAEIQRLDALKNDLNNTIKSNQLQIVNLTRDLEKANNEIEKDQKQIEVYKEAIQKANDNILKQNEEIKKANEEMKSLAEDRNEVVKKFNKLAADFKELADKWNQHMAEHEKASTNAPPKK